MVLSSPCIVIICMTEVEDCHPPLNQGPLCLTTLVNRYKQAAGWLILQFGSIYFMLPIKLFILLYAKRQLIDNSLYTHLKDQHWIFRSVFWQIFPTPIDIAILSNHHLPPFPDCMKAETVVPDFLLLQSGIQNVPLSNSFFANFTILHSESSNSPYYNGILIGGFEINWLQSTKLT